MKTIGANVCDWEIADFDESCAGCNALEQLSDEQRDRVEAMAIELLWNWSGRKFGLCDVVVRPCRSACLDTGNTFAGRSQGWEPVIIDGQWWNVSCSCVDSCGCAVDGSRALTLPGSVAEITEIWIHGNQVTDFELRDNTVFLKSGVFPACNDQFADPKETDSPAWVIEYKRGIPVPVGGQVAAHLLACQLAKAICGDNDCQLPKRLQSVTRQGVSVAVLDGFENLDEGRTGIWEIDSWLASVTHKLSNVPQVFSPDIPAGFQAGLASGIGFGRTK